MRRSIFLFLIIIAVLSNLELDYIGAEQNSAIAKEEKAVDFTLTTHDGQISQLSNHAGKIIVLNFWTTWCAYCQEELNELSSFYTSTKPKNIKLIGVNVTSSEKSQEAVKQFINDSNLPFEIVLDVTGEVSKSYQILGIPTTFIIDEQGIIRKKILGPVTSELLQEAISNLSTK